MSSTALEPASMANRTENKEIALPQCVAFGREICGALESAEQREWLVTNGIGGFASGTVAGSLTRRYHGMLVAALTPPLGRTLLVSKLEETVECDGAHYALGTNRWSGGVAEPRGYEYIEQFYLDGTTPVWHYALGDALIEKRVWMQHGANTTLVRYRMLRGSRNAALRVRALVNYRDYHATTRAGNWQMSVGRIADGLRIAAFDGATPFFLRCRGAIAMPAHDWYRNFFLPAEQYRGLDAAEDHLHAGTFDAELRPGQELLFVLTTEPDDSASSYTDEQRREREEMLVKSFAGVNPAGSAKAPDWIRQLALAADQFIVQRPLSDDPEAMSVIAGYHWFGDWGRDTMIALPGLALATGRPEIARKILQTFARFVNQGMLPNLFPDAGSQPEYNTVDATLWYFEAIRQYVAATSDDAFLAEMFPVLAGIVDWHLRGTRYRIKVDHTDGLLFAGEPGVQLTWMDAKVGDWVVTPRIGKPVEINALWYNALSTMVRFARQLKKKAGDYEFAARRARESFQRFWNEPAGYCFDVIDGPAGNDASLRPNQIFAVALPESPLMNGQGRKVVDACARHLLTSHGLRSLARYHADYKPRYGGSPAERDGAYHQGTVWGWLIGPFVLAHLRVHNDAGAALSFLQPFADHLRTHGLGTAAEIFDAEPPFAPRGCIAQAWTVGEILRAWRECSGRLAR